MQKEIKSVSQRYFEVQKNEFIDRGKEELLYGRGAERLWQKIAIEVAGRVAVIGGMVLGAVMATALGFSVSEIFTGRGFSQPLTSDESTVIALTAFLPGAVAGAIGGVALFNKKLASLGLMELKSKNVNYEY